MSTFRDFFNGYLTCALWSSTDNADESGGEPLDRNYGPEDIAFGSLLSMARECWAFLRDNEELLARYAEELPERGEWTQDERAGHDFWLTRNGHGAGFWDRGLPRDVGYALTWEAKAWGGCDLYVGDDGKLHVST